LLRKESDQVLQRAPQPIDRPGHHHIELPAGGIFAERVEGRAFVPALGAADPLIAVDLDDVPTSPGRDGAQLALLILGRLAVGRDARVERDLVRQ
jgi:hypothetical protein